MLFLVQSLIYQICNSTGQNIGHNDGEYRFSNNNKVLDSNMGLTIREKLMGNSLDVMTYVFPIDSTM